MTDQVNSSDSDEYYKQYLHSLFGDSIAEYFLSLSYSYRDTPVWFREMKDSMKDHVSAEALWDALRKRSAQIIAEMENKTSQVKQQLMDWKDLKKQDHTKHILGLRFMFRTAQYNQAVTALILRDKCLSLPE